MDLKQARYLVITLAIASRELLQLELTLTPTPTPALTPIPTPDSNPDPDPNPKQELDGAAGEVLGVRARAWRARRGQGATEGRPGHQGGAAARGQAA
eukprot:scaffold40585_cov44-Phaeocystis_antarctica.AAC.1